MSNDTATTDNAIAAENVNTDHVNTDNANITANNSSNGEVTDEKVASPKGRWPWSGRNKKTGAVDPPSDNDVEAGGRGRPTKWSMGVLNDPRTHEVPGTFSFLLDEIFPH